MVSVPELATRLSTSNIPDQSGYFSLKIVTVDLRLR